MDVKCIRADCMQLYDQQRNADSLDFSQFSRGNTCAISPISEEQIARAAITPETAFLTRQLLYSAIWGGGDWKQKTGWNGTGWRAARALNRHDMGGKTGTTNDSKDAWFSGFVGNVVALPKFRL